MEQWETRWADYYAELRCSPDDPVEVVLAVHRALARVYHPDSGSKPDAEKMKRVNAARDVLADPVKRKAYDRAFRARNESASSSTTEPPPRTEPEPADRASDATSQRSNRKSDPELAPFRVTLYPGPIPGWRGDYFDARVELRQVATGLTVDMLFEGLDGSGHGFFTTRQFEEGDLYDIIAHFPEAGTKGDLFYTAPEQRKVRRRVTAGSFLLIGWTGSKY